MTSVETSAAIPEEAAGLTEALRDTGDVLKQARVRLLRADDAHTLLNELGLYRQPADQTDADEDAESPDSVRPFAEYQTIDDIFDRYADGDGDDAPSADRPVPAPAPQPAPSPRPGIPDAPAGNPGDGTPSPDAPKPEAPRRPLTPEETKKVEEQGKETKKAMEAIGKRLPPKNLGEAQQIAFSVEQLRATCARVPGYDMPGLEATLSPFMEKLNRYIQLGEELGSKVKNRISRLRSESDRLKSEADTIRTKDKNRGIGTRALGFFNGDNGKYSDLYVQLLQRSTALSGLASRGEREADHTYFGFDVQLAYVAEADKLLEATEDLTPFRNAVNGILPSLTPGEFVRKRGIDPAIQAGRDAADAAKNAADGARDIANEAERQARRIL